MKTYSLLLLSLIVACQSCSPGSGTLIADCRIERPDGIFIPHKVLVEVYNSQHLPSFNRMYADANGTAVFKNLRPGEYTVHSIWIDNLKNLKEYTQVVSIINTATIEMNALVYETTQ